MDAFLWCFYHTLIKLYSYPFLEQPILNKNVVWSSRKQH